MRLLTLRRRAELLVDKLPSKLTGIGYRLSLRVHPTEALFFDKIASMLLP